MISSVKLLLANQTLEKLRVPLFEMDVDVQTALATTAFLYFGSGILLLYSTAKCRKVLEFQFEGSNDLRFFPSFVHAGLVTKIAAYLGPLILLGALLTIPEGSYPFSALFTAVILSFFHFLAFFKSFGKFRMNPDEDDGTP